jgi:tRNA(fMet)-specific endonuclease VapC
VSRLIDTDICIALIRGRPHGPRTRLAACRNTVAVSTIVLFELAVGVEKSGNLDFEEERLRSFLARFTVLSFDAEDARKAARVRARLERDGMAIGSYDTLLAGQALARGLVLVTGNLREFRRVEGLRLESWTD